MNAMTDLPRVLLENYLMLAAAIENQNLGRMHDMLQYQQKVHKNLLDIVQHIEDAPAVAMTTTARELEFQQEIQPPPEDQPSPAGDPLAYDYSREQQQQQAPCSDQQHPTRQMQQHPCSTQTSLQPHQQHAAQQSQTLQQQQQQVAALPAWMSAVNQPVVQFLQGLGLQEYESLLQQQAVDMAALQLMEERHLRELGLPIGAVVKIKAALAALH